MSSNTTSSKSIARFFLPWKESSKPPEEFQIWGRRCSHRKKNYHTYQTSQIRGQETTIINKGRSTRSALKQVRFAFQTAQTSLPDRPRSDHAKLKPSPVAEPHLGVHTRPSYHARRTSKISQLIVRNPRQIKILRSIRIFSPAAKFPRSKHPTFHTKTVPPQHQPHSRRTSKLHLPP